MWGLKHQRKEEPAPEAMLYIATGGERERREKKSDRLPRDN